jgi:hypothetical protein
MNTKLRIPLAVTVVLMDWAALIAAGPAGARDNGQWEATPQEVRDWYRGLKQPDHPRVSCCGEADAYWADSFTIEDGRTVAIITDTRDDAPLGRPHIAPGTRVVVPNHKLKFDAGNPTGHGVIFVSPTRHVYCYVTPGGV